jgi:hypothetical protein
MRKKTKMANICRSLQKKKKLSSPQVTYPNIGFIGVKKNGSKISHLGTFKQCRVLLKQPTIVVRA